MKDKIIELRKMGFSYNEISEKLNCAKSTISYYCSKLVYNNNLKENNTIIKNKKQKNNTSFLLKDISLDDVIELRRNKKTYDEIKEITGLSKHIISKICREYNLVKTRKRGELSEIEIQEIKNLYNEVKSIRKVSRILNVDRTTIRKYIDVDNTKLSDKQLKINSVRQVIDWRKRVKVKLVEYKGGECVKCGYKKCTQALQFHHTNPDEKDFTISGKSWSFERLKKEVDKCILVCSNCHTEIHEKINMGL